jgi:hypothetical protein
LKASGEHVPGKMSQAPRKCQEMMYFLLLPSPRPSEQTVTLKYLHKKEPTSPGKFFPKSNLYLSNCTPYSPHQEVIWYLSLLPGSSTTKPIQALYFHPTSDFGGINRGCKGWELSVEGL